MYLIADTCCGRPLVDHSCSGLRSFIFNMLNFRLHVLLRIRGAVRWLSLLKEVEQYLPFANTLTDFKRNFGHRTISRASTVDLT